MNDAFVGNIKNKGGICSCCYSPTVCISLIKASTGFSIADRDLAFSCKNERRCSSSRTLIYIKGNWRESFKQEGEMFTNFAVTLPMILLYSSHLLYNINTVHGAVD